MRWQLFRTVGPPMLMASTASTLRIMGGGQLTWGEMILAGAAVAAAAFAILGLQLEKGKR